MSKAIKPNFIANPFGVENVVIAGFGRNGGETNWKALVDSTVFCGEKTKKRMARAVLQIAGLKNVARIFSPGAGAFNGQICESDDLRQKTAISRNVSFFRGFPAEGLIIPAGSAGAMLPADCNTIVLRSERGNVGIVHAGGFSLIDRLAAITGQNKIRRFASVVDAILARFAKISDGPETLSVFIVRGVRNSNFGYDPDDETFGERNQKILVAFRAIDPSVVVGKSGVDITQVIRKQLEKGGVRGERIQTDATDTYNDRDFGDFTWWSHERAKSDGNDEEATECRNLILVINGNK